MKWHQMSDFISANNASLYQRVSEVHDTVACYRPRLKAYTQAGLGLGISQRARGKFNYFLQLNMAPRAAMLLCGFR